MWTWAPTPQWLGDSHNDLLPLGPHQHGCPSPSSWVTWIVKSWITWLTLNNGDDSLIDCIWPSHNRGLHYGHWNMDAHTLVVRWLSGEWSFASWPIVTTIAYVSMTRLPSHGTSVDNKHLRPNGYATPTWDQPKEVVIMKARCQEPIPSLHDPKIRNGHFSSKATMLTWRFP